MVPRQYVRLGSPISTLASIAIVAAPLLGVAVANAADESTEKKYTAVAYLLVERHEPQILPRQNNKDSKDEFESFRATQMQLIKSPLVINAAIRNPKLRALPRVQREDANHHLAAWLTNAIQVRSPDERTGVLTVSLASTDPQEAATVVNAVVQAYIEEVVDADRSMRRGRLDVLERSFAERSEEVRRKRTELKQLTEQLGLSNADAAKLEVSVLTQHALFCQRKLDESQDDRRRVERELEERKTAGGDLKRLQTQLAAVKDDIGFYGKELDSTRRRAYAIGGTSVDVEMMKKELQRVEEVLRRTKQESELLKIELNARPRVRVLEPAAVPDRAD